MTDDRFDAASAAIFRARQVLLIQRARDPFKGFWTLPGGRRQPQESAAECAMREVEEELGLHVAVTYVTTHSVPLLKGAYVLAVFAANCPDARVRANDEILDFQWRDPADLSDLRCTPKLAEMVAKAARVAERG